MRFAKHTLLPLDDCLYALQATIPQLTRSSLHRCLERHVIGRLPEVEGDKPRRKKFNSYPIGFFHIDLAEARTAEASSTCSWPSTEPRSSWSSNLRKKPTGGLPLPSSKHSSKLFRTVSTLIVAYNFARRLKTLHWPNALRSHLQPLDPRTHQIYTQPHPSNAGTIRLVVKYLCSASYCGRNKSQCVLSTKERESADRSGLTNRGISWHSVHVSLWSVISLWTSRRWIAAWSCSPVFRTLARWRSRYASVNSYASSFIVVQCR